LFVADAQFLLLPEYWYLERNNDSNKVNVLVRELGVKRLIEVIEMDGIN